MQNKISVTRSSVDYWPKDEAELLEKKAKIELLKPNADESQEKFLIRLEQLKTHHEAHMQRRIELQERRIRDLAFMVENLEAFVAFEAMVKTWAYANPQWQEMSQDDVGRLNDLISKVKHNPRDPAPGLRLFMRSTPRSDDLIRDTLKEQVQASDEIYQLLPEETRKMFELNAHIPSDGNHHQMFGLARTARGYEGHSNDYLLLKLGHDNAADWNWGEENAYFWISPDDLSNGRWENVSVTIGYQ